MAHGKVTGRIRECDVHGKHGLLYPCPEYPKEVLDEIERSNQIYKRNLSDPEWCRKQIENGSMTEEAIAVFRAMAGI
jgi:hypothetical protein